MLALPACGASVPQAADFRGAVEGGTAYRYAARGLYKALLTESCERKPELRRAAVLAPEIAAVRAYEAQVSATPAASQLALARSDIEAGNLGCWEDSDPAVARIHVKMARDDVQSGLKKLPGLASGIAAVPETGVDPAKAAAFRALVRDFSDRIDPLCRGSGEDVILAGAKAEFGRLRQRLAPTVWAVHFAIAEADAKHVRDHTQVECADPAPPDKAAAERDARAMKDLNARIAAAAGG